MKVFVKQTQNTMRNADRIDRVLNGTPMRFKSAIGLMDYKRYTRVFIFSLRLVIARINLLRADLCIPKLPVVVAADFNTHSVNIECVRMYSVGTRLDESILQTIVTPNFPETTLNLGVRVSSTGNLNVSDKNTFAAS